MKHLILIALVMLAALSIHAATQFTVGGYKYTITSEEKNEVSIASYAYSDYDIDIPSHTEYNGTVYTVTAIAKNCFYSNRKSLMSVKIPETVTEIGDGAFKSCSSLTSITLPQSLVSIGKETFRSCSSLTSITLPQSLVSIGNSAFESCSSLTSITLPQSLVSIGSSAFSSCRSLISIVIPKGVSSIGQRAFSYCPLEEIIVSGDNPYYSTLDGVLYNKDLTELVICPKTKTSLIVPESLTQIASSAFYGCSLITSIDLPSKLTSIGGYAFYGCTKLSSISLPDSLISIGSSAFNGCTKLSSISLPHSLISIGGSAFYGCTQLSSISLPDSLISIGSSAFSGCTQLTTINIPSLVETIGKGALCDNLTKITVASDNKHFVAIDNVLFDRDLNTLIKCSVNKTSIVIPESIKTLSYGAFCNCTDLELIYIPDSVTLISSTAFSGCTGLKSLTLQDGDTVLTVEDSAPFGSSPLETVYIGRNIQNSKGAPSTCGIPKSLYSLTFGDYITDIQEEAFKDHNNLKYVKIGSGLKVIGANAFAGTSVEHAEFASIESVCGIDFKSEYSNPANINGKMYIGGEEITNLTLPENLEEIPAYAFSELQIEKMNIPPNVTQISAYTLPRSIEHLIIEESNNSIYWYDYTNHTTIWNIALRRDIVGVGGSRINGCNQIWFGKGASVAEGKLFTDNSISYIVCTQFLPPQINSSIFDTYTYYDATVYVPGPAANSAYYYYDKKPWNVFYTYGNMTTGFHNFNLSKQTFHGNVGDEFDLDIIFENSENTISDYIVDWGCSYEYVASVDNNGHVKLLDKGSCTVYAMAALYEGWCFPGYAACEIQCDLASSIENVEDDVQKIEIFDLTGLYMGNSESDLKPGLYVVRRGDTTDKIIIH